MEQNIAIRSSELIDHFGVATHIAYTDGGYRELSTILDALRYLGIDNVRDDAPNPASDAYGQAHIGQAAAAGIDFTFYANGWVDPVTTVARIHAIEQANPGSVTAIEGPNEVNNWPITYQGLTGTAAAQAYMRDLFNAVQADPLLRDIPVTGFTDYPNHSSTSDASTIHSYTKEGDQPYATLVYDMAAQEAVDPGKPFYITETGYHTKINPSYGWEGVSEATQAKFVLNTYMDGVLLGANQIYIYQLLDAYAGTSQEEYFGLFRLDKSPKPAATAIHNLTTILADIGTTAETFATQTLNFTVTNAPTTGHTLLSQKSNGTWQIITWAEPDIWNEATNQAINVAPTSQKISFAQTFQKIEIFDPLLGTSPIRTFTNVSSVNVDVTDHPVIIQVSGPMGATTTVTAPVTTTSTNQPVSLTAGTGPDTLVLRISEEAWNGDAQYTVRVDGVQVGGTFTAKALHALNQSDTVTLKGTWGSGAHTVTVNFLNDAYGGTASADRNLLVDGMTYNGVDHPELARRMNSGGPQDFGLAATSAGAPTTPTTTPTTTQQPVSLTAGTGADTLVLRISEDAWNGDAQYTVKVDGVQIGGVFTAKALHSANQSDTLTLKGTWGSGAHTVTVNFLNDAYGGTAAADRNLHVDGITYNGISHPELARAMNSAGAQDFGLAATSSTVAPTTPTTTQQPVSLTAGTGLDTLVLRISEDAWNGDAQYTVKVDGVQIGGVFTAKALHAANQSDTLTLNGSWGTGAHTVTVNFLNDAYGGTAAADRNLHVDGITYNGINHPELARAMNSAGAQDFGLAATSSAVAPPSTSTQQPVSLTAGTGLDTLVLRISEDAWNGDAQYTVKVDGTQIGGVFTAKALHAANQSDTLTLKGNWGTGAHAVTVNFLNDAYGGTATSDRNLHVDNIIYNGVGHPELAHSQNSAGAQDYAFN